MTTKPTPDLQAIKDHLNFLFSGYDEYEDGLIEIAYTPPDTGAVSKAFTYSITDIDKAAQDAFELNSSQGVNVYVGAALRSPEAPSMGRSNQSHFYASNVAWIDLDDDGTVDKVKELYANIPPSFIVVTGRVPHKRAQMWWKLDECETGQDELRALLDTLCLYMNGDVKVVDPARVMRLGGTVAWPKKDGRVAEPTQIFIPSISTDKVNSGKLLYTYQISDNTGGAPLSASPVTSLNHTEPTITAFGEHYEDGRESYMNSVVFACIVNMTGQLGCWPTAEEVFLEAWPTYAAKAVARAGRTLNQDARGDVAMRGKIRSKLRAFEGGHVRGFETLEIVVQKSQEFKKNDNPVQSAHKSNLIPPELPRSTMRLIMADEIKPVIQANDFVQGLLGDNQFSVVYGESNCGKTFFMTDLCFHVAQGKKWRGKRVEQGGVIYAALEGAYGLGNRLEAYRQHYQDGQGMPFAMINTQLDFMNPEGNISEFIDLVKASAEKLPNVKLIVIDTLARAIAGGDENSGQDMGMLVSHADLIRYHTGAHVCFIHHSGKDRARGARGHSSLRAAVDTEIEISRDEGADYSKVRVVKQREMEMGEDLAFSLKSVTIGVDTRVNEEIKSCVVQTVDIDSLKTVRKDRRLTAIQQFNLDALIMATDAHGSLRSPRIGMSPVMCVTYEEFRQALEESGYRNLYDENEPDSKVKSSTQSARVALQKMGRIDFNRQFLWLVTDGEKDGE